MGTRNLGAGRGGVKRGAERWLVLRIVVPAYLVFDLGDYVRVFCGP